MFFLKDSSMRDWIHALALDAWYAYLSRRPPIWGRARSSRRGGARKDQKSRSPGGGGTHTHMRPSSREKVRLTRSGSLRRRSGGAE
jgi:hypothetical protein